MGATSQHSTISNNDEHGCILSKKFKQPNNDQLTEGILWLLERDEDNGESYKTTSSIPCKNY